MVGSGQWHVRELAARPPAIQTLVVPVQWTPLARFVCRRGSFFTSQSSVACRRRAEIDAFALRDYTTRLSSDTNWKAAAC